MRCVLCGRTIRKNTRYYRDLDDANKHYHVSCVKLAGFKPGPRTPSAKNPKYDWPTPIACPKCGNTNARTLEDHGRGQQMLCRKCGTVFEWGANPVKSNPQDSWPSYLGEQPRSKSGMFALILENYRLAMNRLEGVGGYEGTDENDKYYIRWHMDLAHTYWQLLTEEEQRDFEIKFPGKLENIHAWVLPCDQ